MTKEDEATVVQAIMQERERCAQICEALVKLIEATSSGTGAEAAKHTALSCAVLIRVNS